MSDVCIMAIRGCLAINHQHPIYIAHHLPQPSGCGTAIKPQMTKRKDAMLEAGQKIEPFNLPTDTGSFSLASQSGEKTVIFFFPRADTSGCTKEAIAFSGLLSAFAAAGCAVIGISKDSAAKQAKFRAKHSLTCLLGADDNTDICERFGVWMEKSMYGKTYMGIQRATFILANDGTCLAAWSKVKVAGHAEEVLDTLHGL